MVKVTYTGFDGSARTGTIVVHRAAAPAVARAFAKLHAAGFPIRSVKPIEAFAGSDDASMAADNTSAFNCRPIAGTTRWSEHSYGRAVDVNPIENPWIHGGRVDPPAGAAYLDRADARAGMAVRGGVLVTAFAAEGWRWGGDFAGAKDYQHFSATGR
ncbi:MAG TPA: M15 family metallopeptidase [Acidimicrobiales bacterium]